MKYTTQLAITTTAVLCLFSGITNAQTTTGQSKTKRPTEATPKSKSSESRPQVPFDPEKISRDQVVAAVTAVFDGHGYKPTQTRQQGVQFGAGGTAKPFEEGPVQYVDMELQPPVKGSNSKKWKFRAVINDRSVELMVFIQLVPPRDFLGTKLDSEPTSWQPADTKQVIEEIQKQFTK